MWTCELSGNEIKVFFSDKLRGEYHLTREPYCKYCSSPNTTTEGCTLHGRCYGFERAFAMGPYLPSRSDPNSIGWDDLLSKHIRGLKQYPRYSVPLGQGLATCLNEVFTDLQNMDLIVPVPKFPTELKVSADAERRKYNQAMELSKVICINTGMLCEDALEKVRAQKMKGLSEEERWAVVNGLYKSKDNINVNGKRIILLDDVFTTGATLSECSSILQRRCTKRKCISCRSG